jgi:predicted transcriptional regulator
VNDRQATLEEASSVKSVRGLSENQRKIIALVGEQLCQADIARKLGVSRAYVNQTIKKLESKNLIQRIPTHPTENGKRQYNLFYELAPELKARVKGEKISQPFTSCRVHNLRMKFAIVSQSNPISTDPRTAFQKSWMMRGRSERYKFWFIGKAGMPSVTLDVHPKTIVAYVDRKQFIPAHTPEEAKDIGFRSLYAAVDLFVQQQAKFNVRIETSHTGTTIGKPHGGFVGTETPVMKEGVSLDHWWIDKSVESEVGPGKVELETDVPEGMTRLDNLIKLSENPIEMFKSVIDPLHQDLTALTAHIQGGNTIQYQINQQNTLILKLIEHITNLEKRLGEKI